MQGKRGPPEASSRAPGGSIISAGTALPPSRHPPRNDITRFTIRHSHFPGKPAAVTAAAGQNVNKGKEGKAGRERDDANAAFPV